MNAKQFRDQPTLATGGCVILGRENLERVAEEGA